MRHLRLWLICLVLADGGSARARAGPSQRRRQLFDPRRFRPQCRRRPRQRDDLGRSRWRRARLYAGAGRRQEDRGRQAPCHQRPRPGGLAAAAGAVLGQQGRDRDRDQRHRAAQDWTPLPIRMPGNRSPTPRFMSPISATRWSPPTPRTPRFFAPMRQPIWQNSMRSIARCGRPIAQIPPAPPQGDLDP